VRAVVKAAPSTNSTTTSLRGRTGGKPES
jgi:hypothetical protein